MNSLTKSTLNPLFLTVRSSHFRISRATVTAAPTPSLTRAEYARCLHPEIDSDPALYRFRNSFVTEAGQLGLAEINQRDLEEYDGPTFVYLTSHVIPDTREILRTKLRQDAARWNAEMDYRVVKPDFLPFTNTDQDAVRALVRFWAVALSNA